MPLRELARLNTPGWAPAHRPRSGRQACGDPERSARLRGIGPRKDEHVVIDAAALLDLMVAADVGSC